MRSVTRWRRSGSRFGWLPLGLAAVVLTAVLASVALAQSPELEPPGRPQALQAVVSHDMVSLSWDDPGDASISGYRILRRLRDHSPVGQFEVLVEDTGSAASAYVDRQVQPETRYNYRVKARNAAGLSPRSNFVRADTPPAPVLKQAKQEQEEQQEDQQQQEEQPDEQPDELVTVWTGQLTVGVFSAAAPPVRGYAEWIRQGALGPRDFSFADESYTVLGLFEHGGGLNLVLGRPLPHDFVLELGPRRYESGQSLEPVFVWAGRYWWPDTTLDWAAGEELTVSIILDPSSPATERAAAPPSAYLTELPAAHNGRDPFALKLVFDEPDLPLTAALLRDQALQVSGGSVLAVDQGRRAKDWLITLQPDGDGPLTVSLPSPADCADAGAVCAADGRMLRGRVTATIAGPPKLAALHVVGATLSPAFDPDTELYTAETGLEQVTVEAAADDPRAQLTISPADADPQQAGHQVALAAAGETTIELELKSVTGETARVYWVVLRRSAAAPEPPSSGLNALGFSGLPELEFSEHESRYELDAPEDLEQTTVIVSRAESEAGVDIFTVRGDDLVADDADHDPNAPGHQTLLSAWGDTLLLVRVTSGDGRSQRAYVTHLRGQPHSPPATPGLRSGTRAAPTAKGARDDDDVPTTLSALSLSGADLTPAFASDVFMYQASVATDVAQVTLSATPTAADATLLLIPADADAVQTGYQVNLGAAGAETVIVVIVKNAAGQLNSYLVKVLRPLPATPTTLQSLVVEGHELSPAFAAGVQLYQVAADAHVSEVTLTAVATAATATIQFVPPDADANAPGHQIALGSPGIQTTTPIAIIISSPGVAAHTTYAVTITRAAPDPSDAALSSLSLNGHTLTPAFDPEISDYALTVPADSDSVTLTAVSSSLSAGLSVSPPDADPLAPGHQILLAAVEPGQPPSLTSATVTVTSEDLSATQTYTITITRSTPVTGGFKYIEAGWSYACAIRMDGTSVCWNYAPPIEVDYYAGRRYAEELVTAQPQGGVFVELTGAKDIACGVRPDGETRCWGDMSNRDHTLQGYGNMTQQTEAGQLIDTYTWYSGLRLLADGSVITPGAGAPQSVRTGPYQAIGAGRSFGCGLDLGGHITCWTNGTSMRLPYADVEFKYLGADGTSVCGVRADDSTLRCWTFRGPPYTLLANVPDGAFRMVDMSYGVAFCGLRVDGSVQCWVGRPLTQGNRQARAESPFYGYWVYDRPAELALVALLDDAPDEDTLGYTMVTMDRRFFACGLRTDHSIACWGWDNELLASGLPPFESPWRDSALLVDLTVDNGALLPEFDRDVTEYELSVDNATSAITITPEVTNLFANYAISADTDATVIDDTVDLSVGDNVVTIAVTAADGVTTRDYTVTVTRAAAN